MPSQAGVEVTTGPVGMMGSPHSLIFDGGVGTTSASAGQATVEPPFAGRVKSLRSMVIIQLQVFVLPAQSVKFQVKVLVPSQVIGSGLLVTVGPVTVTGLPQASVIVFGYVGGVNDGHGTVAVPGLSTDNVGTSSVQTNDQSWLWPAQSV